MNEKYLIMNAGSSSLKFTLYDSESQEEIASGVFEKIGKKDSFYTIKYNGKKFITNRFIQNSEIAVKTLIDELLNFHLIETIDEIKGVGHRILHGGELYSDSVVIDDEVLCNIESLTKLGPLHHPGEIAGVLAMKEALPAVPQVAVFDTAFHQTMPKENFLYAVPYAWYEENSVRKYGFHGTSHKYITEQMQNKLQKQDINLIICHIGSGASISCIKNGRCFDTTMGMTPLDGLIMGTRCGSIDPSIIEYICNERNLNVSQVNSILNNQSGLLGLAGENDFRDLETLAEKGDDKAILAIKMMKKSVAKMIANYMVELDSQVDGIIFTAGIGENSMQLREDVINMLANTFGLSIDKKQNESIAKFKECQSGKISSVDSRYDIYVIPTNEEYMIFKDTLLLTKNKDYKKVLSRG